MIVSWSTKRYTPRRAGPFVPGGFGGFAMLAMTLKVRPPSVLSATGTTFSKL